MIAAGVDIGNSTTEIVIADLAQDPPVPLAWDRRRTRGTKGSPEASAGAEALLARMERRLGRTVDRVVLTPQSPVATDLVGVDRTAGPLGRVRVLAAAARTPAGSGVAVGRPVAVTALEGALGEGPVVAVGVDPLGFRDTAARIRRAVDAGCPVAGVLLAGDEARLVSARLGIEIPVVDGVDAAATLAMDRVALEVAAPGGTVRTLLDPIWLSAGLGLHPTEHRDAAQVGRELAGVGCAAVGLLPHRPAARDDPTEVAGLVFSDGGRLPLTEGLERLRHLPVGACVGLAVPPAEARVVGDVWGVDLDRAETLPRLRSGPLHRRHVTVSSASPRDRAVAHPEVFRTGRRDVAVVADETSAARAGALSTPGVNPDALVVDLGGGTMDLVSDRAHTAAGSGELLTAAVAHVLSLSLGAAEWVKRGPALRVEEPFVAGDESGVRHFLEQAAAPGTVGWLTAPGPSGPLPFGPDLTPSEWRSVRLALKTAVFADNLRRVAAQQPGLTGRDVVLVGGPAEDDEILAVVAEAIGGPVFGRADVAGRLGTRWAVAYGLLLV